MTLLERLILIAFFELFDEDFAIREIYQNFIFYKNAILTAFVNYLVKIFVIRENLSKLYQTKLLKRRATFYLSPFEVFRHLFLNN